MPTVVFEYELPNVLDITVAQFLKTLVLTQDDNVKLVDVPNTCCDIVVSCGTVT
jgi:hypothetical protein